MRAKNILHNRKSVGISTYTRNSGDPGSTGSFITWNITTARQNNAGITKNSNQLTLPAGKYVLSASGGGTRCGWNCFTFYNITDSVEFTNARSPASYFATTGGGFEDTNQHAGMILDLSDGGKTVDIRHRYYNNPTAAGQGAPVGTLTIYKFA